MPSGRAHDSLRRSSRLRWSHRRRWTSNRGSKRVYFCEQSCCTCARHLAAWSSWSSHASRVRCLEARRNPNHWVSYSAPGVPRMRRVCAVACAVVRGGARWCVVGRGGASGHVAGTRGVGASQGVSAQEKASLTSLSLACFWARQRPTWCIEHHVLDVMQGCLALPVLGWTRLPVADGLAERVLHAARVVASVGNALLEDFPAKVAELCEDRTTVHAPLVAVHVAAVVPPVPVVRTVPVEAALACRSQRVERSWHRAFGAM